VRYSRNYGALSTGTAGAAARAAPAFCVTAPPGPTVEVNRALERVGGDRALLGELVEIFLQDLPGRLQLMRKDVLPMAEIQRVAHDLKGSLATLGAQRASAMASSLEDACREARPDAVAPLVTGLEAELLLVQAFFSGPGWAGDG